MAMVAEITSRRAKIPRLAHRGAVSVRYQCATHLNEAAICKKFRRRSHFQNYILRMNNISDYQAVNPRFSLFMHFVCKCSAYRSVVTR
ncbi:hypothetical protein CHU32_03330 [Superficieibacter electus]|uniref:Uncharacterized protein n=1 Tax=Superficieibacter electus TaxID=2022662 RepID=A0A2P5GV84_9ENTR|nr:hypothetical protein CHU33_19615 [Superficieibacter electus]POP50472.1 hypothetical protein CHU32_03330 [Superficieibacter electus]